MRRSSWSRTSSIAWRGAATRAERRRRAVAAAVEVARPIAFATLIVIVVFLPLFGMSGIEGRMYQPLAAAVIAAMVAALVLSVTVVPIAAGFILRPGRAGSDDDVALLRWIKARYAPLLDRCLRHPRIVALVTLVLAGPALALALLVGSDFMPQLDEGAFLLQTILPPEASLEEVDRLNHRVEDILRQVPEVEDVVRRTGRAERTEDPMPHTLSDVLVTLKVARARDLAAIEDDMRERLENLPGIAVLFTTPLGMRIDEGLGGHTRRHLGARLRAGSQRARAPGRGGRAHHGRSGRIDRPARGGPHRAAAVADRGRSAGRGARSVWPLAT
jgi:cobalt-zinc-cadmium resistance protein CzcA